MSPRLLIAIKIDEAATAILRTTESFPDPSVD